MKKEKKIVLTMGEKEQERGREMKFELELGKY